MKSNTERIVCEHSVTELFNAADSSRVVPQAMTLAQKYVCPLCLVSPPENCVCQHCQFRDVDLNYRANKACDSVKDVTDLLLRLLSIVCEFS